MTPRHTLVQITDPHLLPRDQLLHDQLDTSALLARTLAVVEQADVRPTALVFTGDLADGGEPAAYRRLRELVEPVAARLGTTAVYVMGNHDRRAELREHLLDETAGTAPLDYVVQLDGLRIIVLDSTVPGFAHGELSGGQLSWLAAQLARPAPDGTVLAVHHPPLPPPCRLAAAIELTGRLALAKVLADSDVRLILSGHTHVLGAGSLAGIPVWMGGSTAYSTTPLGPGGGLQTMITPAVSRIDLYDDELLVSAALTEAELVGTMSPVEIDAMIAAIPRP